MLKSVRYRKQTEIAGESKDPLSIEDGIERVKKFAAVISDRTYKNGKKRKGVDQTVELVMHLGIDPRQADQMLRGSLSLPNGVGKSRRVIAFCAGPVAEAAKEAGAVEVGGEELIEKIVPVIDPEIGISIVHLGLVYDAELDPEGVAKVTMTLTSPQCPMGPQIMSDVRRRLEPVEGIREVKIDLVWEPTWNPRTMVTSYR